MDASRLDAAAILAHEVMHSYHRIKLYDLIREVDLPSIDLPLTFSELPFAKQLADEYLPS